MGKTLYLCFACAAALTEAFTVRELPGRLKNAKCDRCSRKAWGATYRICIKITAALPTKAAPRLTEPKHKRIP